MTTTFATTDEELQIIREALVKRIDRACQKIKHWTQHPEKQAQQPGVIFGETVRVQKLHAIIAKIDLQLKPVHNQLLKD